MSTATVELAGTLVPALPDDLHPVATAAQDLVARTWGVVVWPDDGAPFLVGTGELSPVAAARLAGVLAVWYGPRVFIAYRCPSAVTVHNRHPELAHNLLGTLPVTPAAGGAGEWDRITHRHYDDPGRDAEHGRLVNLAIRRAHHLPDALPADQVLPLVVAHPVPDTQYVTAYTRLLADDLPAHAAREHRREHTHSRCVDCGSRIRFVRANTAQAGGNPCMHAWHDVELGGLS